MKKYDSIIKHYESCLDKHGDTHLGVDWPNEKDASIRYEVMLKAPYYNMSQKKKVYTLLDFGCGTGHLLEYIQQKNYSQFQYNGLDISENFVNVCRKKFPNIDFFCADVLEKPNIIKRYDYIILNGVFTEKRDLNFSEMWEYFKELINIVFDRCDMGIAFNLMSKHVDWERDDLFHVPHDLLTDYLTKNLSRDYIIRNDYKMFEYTTYVYKS